MDIAEKILDQIAHHRAEILRLESALQVFEEMSGKSAKTKQSPMITIRRTVPQAQVEAPKTETPKAKKAALPIKSRARGIEERRKLREGVLAALAEHESMSTRQLITRFGPKNPDEADKQVIYALMYELRQAGIVTRSEKRGTGTERFFSLVHKPELAAAG